MISGLIGTGQIGYCIIALTLLEIAGLFAWRRLTGRGPGVAAVLPNIVAGDFILLAWPLSRMDWRWSALCLVGALLAHGTDLGLSWRVKADAALSK